MGLSKRLVYRANVDTYLPYPTVPDYWKKITDSIYFDQKLKQKLPIHLAVLRPPQLGRRYHHHFVLKEILLREDSNKDKCEMRKYTMVEFTGEFFSDSASANPIDKAARFVVDTVRVLTIGYPGKIEETTFAEILTEGNGISMHELIKDGLYHVCHPSYDHPNHMEGKFGRANEAKKKFNKVYRLSSNDCEHLATWIMTGTGFAVSVGSNIGNNIIAGFVDRIACLLTRICHRLGWSLAQELLYYYGMNSAESWWNDVEQVVKYACTKKAGQSVCVSVKLLKRFSVASTIVALAEIAFAYYTGQLSWEKFIKIFVGNLAGFFGAVSCIGIGWAIFKSLLFGTLLGKEVTGWITDCFQQWSKQSKMIENKWKTEVITKIAI